MPRLYDLMRREGIQTLGKVEKIRGIAYKLYTLNWEEDIVFKIDNVAEYFHAQEDTHWSIESFPNLAPPFPNFFMEFRVPKIIQNPNSSINEKISHVGMHIQARDIRVEEEYWRFAKANMSHYDIELARWLILATPVFKYQRHRRPAVPCGVTFFVKPDGTALKPKGAEGSTTMPMIGIPFAEAESGNFEATLGNTSFDVLYPCLLSVSMLHCKNVEMVENTPPEKVNKKAMRRHGVPLTTYKTLEIEPMKKVLRSEGGSGEQGLKKALHICRGHFKTFGGGNKKLFGRVEGTFWWNSQVRGSKESGEVVKDYEVLNG